jgi:hypothetical protein
MVRQKVPARNKYLGGYDPAHIAAQPAAPMNNTQSGPPPSSLYGSFYKV